MKKTNLTNILLASLLSCLLLAFNNNVQAKNPEIIIDAEINYVINQLATPIIKAANMKPADIKIFVINDDELNAFTIGQNQIYLNSGLIQKFSANTVQGVIAHELGHIIAYHPAIRSVKFAQIQKLSLLGTIAGFATAFIAPDVGMGMIIGSADYSENILNRHSQRDEGAADNIALNLLEKSGNSAQGLQDFMQVLISNKQNNYNFHNKYAYSHPPSELRLSYIKNFLDKSANKQSNYSPILLAQYVRVQAKLEIFNKSAEQILSKYSKSQDVLAIYKKSYALAKIGKLDKAIKLLKLYQQKFPNDAFIYALLAEYYLSAKNGHQALLHIEKANKILQNNNDLLLEQAFIEYNLANNSNKQIAKKYYTSAKHNLQQIINNDKDNLLALIYLANIMRNNQQLGEADYYMALFYFKINKIKELKIFANRALSNLPKNSVKYLKIKDMLLLN